MDMGAIPYAAHEVTSGARAGELRDDGTLLSWETDDHGYC